ncbi:hypothetical protein [Mycolicibacterium hodleri]|uniref:hypothetical protein n=1 Tax=Mycolicibacterium hodleri TaxID=49897 RepID=UPI0021F3B4EE|nr:hypothetical protein [Mycolicibacterium hodleri]
MTIFALFHPALDDVASPAGGFLADRTTKPVTAQDVLRRYRQYRAVFPRTGITVAAQALRLPAVAEAVKKRGHSVDARSCEELVLALATGIPAQRIVMHDDGITAAPIRRAVNAGVGRLVLTCCRQVGVLEACVGRPPRVMLDVTTDCVDDAVDAVLARPRIDLIGFQARLRRDACRSAYAETAVEMISRMAHVRRERGVILTRISMSGGAILSDRTTAPCVLRELAAELDDAFDDACARYHFPRPALTLAPR